MSKVESKEQRVDVEASEQQLLEYGIGKPSRPQLISWENIDLSVKLKKGKKSILEGLSGFIEPGQLCAIMGPSGAGKSSLLNVLAGRTYTKGNVTLSGKVFVNNKEVNPREFRRQIAYVMQDNALFATQTPREAFHFSAALRLPKSVTQKEKNALVENMLATLALTKCADTYCGSVMIRGLSGGEQKRTAIGIELISNPGLLFLDEPTSGLDSYAAFKVVKTLKSLAASGRTVVTTIHQPSSEVFNQFDRVLLLAAGRVVYHDKVSDIARYFGELGHPCPANFNPADHVMFRIQEASGEELEDMANSWVRYPHPVPEVVQKGSGEAAPLKRKGLSTQFFFLVRREVRNLLRDKGSMGARIGTTVFLNIIVGFVFTDAGNWEDVQPVASAVVVKLNAHLGALMFVAIGGMFGLSQPALLSFPVERPVFLREYATGCYNAMPYFISKMLVEIPMMIFGASLSILTTYWLVGFSSNFFLLTLIVAMLGLVSASTALLIGAFSSDVTVAIQLSPLLFVPQLLFAGFFIPITMIPEWLRWSQYLCSLKYSINVLVLLEFDVHEGFESFVGAGEDKELRMELYQDGVYGCHGAELNNGVCSGVMMSDALFPRSEIEVADLWMYLVILSGVLLVFRLMALFALVQKARA